MNVVLLVNFQDIENEDTVISFQALKIATKNKKQTNRKIFGNFSSVRNMENS